GPLRAPALRPARRVRPGRLRRLGASCNRAAGAAAGRHALMSSTPTSPLTRIVLTGGPGAGKTVIAEALADGARLAAWREEVGGVMLVPEAATQVYAARRTRWDHL